MNEFLANNWFSIFTVVCLIGSSGVHYGISKQRNKQTGDAVERLEASMTTEVQKLELHLEHKFEEVSAAVRLNAATLQAHTSNADIHVSSILLELLKTRHEFVTQQLSDTRADIGRIEQQLQKG